MEKVCKIHGWTKYTWRPSSGCYRCNRCASEAVTKRRKKMKSIALQMLGGQCSLCGYNRFTGALEFHHLDPTTKKFNISGIGQTYSLTRIQEEVKKCALLCSNCHKEVEAGVTQLGSVLRS